MNADTNDRSGNTDAKSAARSTPIAVRLVPASDSDRPVLANYVSLQPASGMLLFDFGFLEPSVLAVLPNVARRGGKLPESLNGRLAVRVAMGYDGAVQLQNQLTRLLTQMTRVAEPGNRGGEKAPG